MENLFDKKNTSSELKSEKYEKDDVMIKLDNISYLLAKTCEKIDGFDKKFEELDLKIDKLDQKLD